MTTCIRALDPAERENAKQFIQALGDTKPAGEQATSSTKETEATKRQRRRWASVIYINEESYWADSERRANS